MDSALRVGTRTRGSGSRFDSSRLEQPRPLATITALAAAASVLALVLGLLLAGSGPKPSPEGLPDAGAATGWALRIADLGVDLVAVLAVGMVLTAAALVPERGPLGVVAGRAVVIGGRLARLWGLSALCLFMLTAADLAGVAVTALDVEVLRTVAGTGTGTSLLVVAGSATGVGLAARLVTTRRGAVLLLGGALATLVPPAVAGHATSAADHQVAASGLVVHVVTASVWVGGLAGLLYLRSSPRALAVALPRFSAVALWAYVALAGSGVLVATAHLGTQAEAWASSYGAVLVAKALLLVVLGWIGLRHRRRSLAQVATGRFAPFLRLAAVEVSLMGAAAGLAVALSRTAPPELEPSSTGLAHGSSHASLPTAVAPFSFSELATAWRPDAVVLVVLAVVLGAYLRGVRTLRRAGRPWPWRRIGSFASGVVMAAAALCSGAATYAPAMVSVDVAQLLVVLLLVPALLTLGRPVTLFAELHERPVTDAPPPAVLDADWARLLTGPFTGVAAVCAVVLALFRTPLIELSLRSPWTHLLVLVAALLAGMLLLWPVLGADPVPQRRTAGERGLALLGVAGCLGLLAYQLRAGDQLLAAPWFLELRWGWVDPVADQRLAGSLTAVAASGLVAVAGAVVRRGR